MLSSLFALLLAFSAFGDERPAPRVRHDAVPTHPPSVTASLYLRPGQRVKLTKLSGARKNFDFRPGSAEKILPLPAGTELKVIETRRLPSGNYGVEVEFQLEGKTGRGWIYYQPDKPDAVLIGDNGEPVKREERDDSDSSFLDLPSLREQVQVDAVVPDGPGSRPADTVEASLVKIAELSAKMAGTAPLPPQKNMKIQRGYYSPDEVPGGFRPRSSASQCEKRDFREKLGDVRDQDGLGWCFAYAASDLLGFYTGKRPSPFELSVRYFQRADMTGESVVKQIKEGAGISGAGGGNVGMALQLAMREGVCAESVVPSTDYVQSYLSGLATNDPLRRELEAQVKRGRLDWLANVMLKVESFQNQRGDLLKDPALTCQAALSANLLFPTLDMAAILAALKSGKTKAEIFNWLAHLSCEKKDQLPPELKNDGLVLGNNEMGNGHRFFPQIDKLLDKNEPVAVTYNPTHFRVDENAPPGSRNTDDLHVSLIVGREFRDGKCQYLLRNTWGPSCSGYKRPCERGHFWMTEEDVNSHVSQLEYMERK